MRVFHVVRDWENGDSNFNISWCGKKIVEVKNYLKSAEIAASCGYIKEDADNMCVCKKCAEVIIDSINNIKER